MNRIQLLGLIINLIIYIIMILPCFIMSFFSKFYKNKKRLLIILLINLIINIVFSIIIYKCSDSIFSIFTNTPGIINYGIYTSKILFMSSSLYSLKIIIPMYLFKNNRIKKVAILLLTKIATTLILSLFGICFFNTKGFLFALPISDFIYYIIYSFELLKILR